MSLSSTPELSSEQTKSSTSSRGRGRGRGGLGKYLRARGRGRGYGRPAEFSKRHLLEGEEPEEEDEEAKAERLRKYSRRQLTSNADRYAEPEPELGSDGEPIEEPEVDLSRFLARQRISDSGAEVDAVPAVDDDDVDHSLAHISTNASVSIQSKKGRMEQIEWDDQLEELSREKAVADAQRDLKSRLRAKKEQLQKKPVIPKPHDLNADDAVMPPALPDAADAKPKSSKEEMQDFLDELLE